MEGSSETTEKVKKSLSSFLGVISDTLAPPPDKTIDCDVITLVATPAGTTEVYDSSKVGRNSTCTFNLKTDLLIAHIDCITISAFCKGLLGITGSCWKPEPSTFCYFPEMYFFSRDVCSQLIHLEC